MHLYNDHFAKIRMDIAGIFCLGGDGDPVTLNFSPFYLYLALSPVPWLSQEALLGSSISYLKTTPRKGGGGGGWEPTLPVILFGIATRFWLKIKLNLQP